MGRSVGIDTSRNIHETPHAGTIAVIVEAAVRFVALRERQLPVTQLTIDLRPQQTAPTFELPQKCLKISSDARCPNQSFGDRKSSSLFKRYGMLGGNFCEVT